MATKNELPSYRATAVGYYDGKVRNVGEVFPADFREILREEPDEGALKRFEQNGGKRPFGDIKRDKEGNALRGSVKVPSWAEPVSAKDAAAAEAASGDFADPVFEDMSKAALEAYCATNNIPFDKTMSKADLVAACHAQTNFQT